jgi:hypothetical protein
MPPWKPPSQKRWDEIFGKQDRDHRSVISERDAGIQICMSFQERPSFLIGQYADYVNFSDLSLNTAIDDAVSAVAKEMSYKMAQSLDAMVNAAFGYTSSKPIPPSSV